MQSPCMGRRREGTQPHPKYETTKLYIIKIHESPITIHMGIGVSLLQALYIDVLPPTPAQIEGNCYLREMLESLAVRRMTVELDTIGFRGFSPWCALEHKQVAGLDITVLPSDILASGHLVIGVSAVGTRHP